MTAMLTEQGWKLRVVNKTHNHGASPNMLAYPMARRPSVEDVERVVEMSKANMAPKQIVGVLREPNKLLLAQDINNILKQQRRKVLGGYTPTQALIKELEQKEKWSYKMECDDEGYLKRHFFTYVVPISIVYGYACKHYTV